VHLSFGTHGRFSLPTATIRTGARLTNEEPIPFGSQGNAKIRSAVSVLAASRIQAFGAASCQFGDVLPAVVSQFENVKRAHSLTHEQRIAVPRQCGAETISSFSVRCRDLVGQ